jgi:8-oxo-dGTP pyrophosphatase MutT (NUDIX family)
MGWMSALFTSRPRQAAAVPVCRTSNGDLQVCLIRRREGGQWGIPKGSLDPGDTPPEAALREAYEEAGISGRLVGDAIGTYTYSKAGSRYTVAVFLMEVSEEERSWPEAGLRVRAWYGVEEALSLLGTHPVKSLIDGVRARIAEGHV